MKLVRVFVASFSLSLRRSLAFRTHLLFESLATFLGVGAGLAALGIVYTQAETLGGWSAAEAIVLLGTYQVVSGLLWTFIEPNLLWFRGQVVNGRLDDILLQPVPGIYLASLGSCSPLGLLHVVAGVGILAVGMASLDAPPTVADAFSWLLQLGAAVVVTWASRVLLASLAFWAPSLQPDVLYSAVWQFGRYPVSMYRQPLRFGLTWVIPVSLMGTLPAQALTRGADPIHLVAGLIAAAGAIGLANAVWQAGLRRYTSATS